MYLLNEKALYCEIPLSRGWELSVVFKNGNRHSWAEVSGVRRSQQGLSMLQDGVVPSLDFPKGVLILDRTVAPGRRLCLVRGPAAALDDGRSGVGMRAVCWIFRRHHQHCL